MPSAEVLAKELARKGHTGPTPTWPPCEPLTQLQVKTFPRSLLSRLKILAIRMDKKLPETLALVMSAGLEVVEKSVDNPNGEANNGRKSE